VLDTNTSPQGSGKTVMSNLAKKQNVASETATMSLVKEVSANGNGKVLKIEEAVAEVIPEVKEEVIPAPVVEAPKPVEKVIPVITLEQKMEKVEALNITISKWNKLQVARKGLLNFKLGTDGMNSTLTLKDADGTPFSTSNPVVVESALSHIRKVLNEKIAEAEEEINFSI